MKIYNSEMIEAQILKAEEKLQVARTLADSGHADDAISRAYYAAFHAGSAVLLSAGITVESHPALKTMFGLHFIRTEKIDRQFGMWLSRLKDERENGDYDIHSIFDSSDALDADKRAGAFVAEMRRYLDSLQNETS